MAQPTTKLLATSAWEPLPATIARLVTADDHEFVERVRDDLKPPALKSPRQLKEQSFHLPYVLVRCLEIELRNAKPILGSPRDQFPGFPNRDWGTDWVTAGAERAEQRLRGEMSSSFLLANPCGGRFQQLLADFERCRQQRLPELTVEDHLRQFLRDRFDVAVAEICEGIENERIEAKGVLVDGGKEHPAGLIPASAVTKDMRIGDDGLLYQGEYKRSPAWKSVEVRARQLHLSSPGVPLDTFRTARAEVKSKRGPDGAGPALQEAYKAIGNRRFGEQKKAYRKRLSDRIKDEGGTPPSDQKTFRKYGY